MHELVDEKVEQQALLHHTALCFVVAGALGFLGGGLAGLAHVGSPPAVARYVMVFASVMTSFVIFWCSPSGPRRWRPFVISAKLAESLFGSAAGVIVFSGLAILVLKIL